MLAGLVLLALSTSSAAGEESLEDFFASFAERRNAIETLQARFIQTTETPDESILSEGVIVYVRPRRLIFRYADPELTYMLDELNAYEFDPELEQMQIYALEDRPESEAYYLGFENNVARLQEAYDVQILPDDQALPGARALEIRPKNPDDEEAFFQSVTLQLRDSDYLPIAIRIVNDAESHVEFTITDFNLNQPVDSTVTHINLPEGTTVVDNDVFSGTVGPEGMQVPASLDSAVQSESLDPESASP